MRNLVVGGSSDAGPGSLSAANLPLGRATGSTTVPTSQRAIRIAIAVLLATAVSSLLWVTPPAFWSSSYFLAGALAFLVYVEAPRARLPALLLGVLMAVGYSARWSGSGQWLLATFNGFGAAGMVVATSYALWSEDADGARARRAAALCVLLFPAYLYLALLALNALAAAAPPTFDGMLAIADRSLVGDASFGVGRWLADHRAIRSTAYLAYQGAPVVLVAGAGLYRRRRPRRGFDVLVGVVVAGALGFALYSIVPAAGPIYRWGAAFPLHPPRDIAPTLARAGGYPNAMPSVHMACAVIMLAALWPVGLKERAFGVLFITLTLIATLGFGQHYLIDLIVAVPFGMMAWLVALRPPNWRRWSLACGALVVVWLFALRWAAVPVTAPSLAWLATSAAVTLSVGALWSMKHSYR